MLAILERPGGALWLVERGKPAKLDALAASPPAMSVIGDTVYIVARAPAPAALPGAVAPRRRVGGQPTLDGVPASGGGPFKAVAAAGRPANLGAGGQNHAVVLRPSPDRPGTLAVERMPSQASRTAEPTSTN